MSSINTNTGALYSSAYAKRASVSAQRSMERLSAGLRLNSAADDAAGASVSTKLLSQVRGINTSIRNSSDGISLIQSALSGIGELSSIIQRMRELSVQMNNGVYTNGDRKNAQNEIKALLNEVIRISDSTSFNGVNILDGGYDQFIRSGNFNAEIVPIVIDGMGIFNYIRGKSIAVGTTEKILRSFAPATGTSIFNTPKFTKGSETVHQKVIAGNTKAYGNSVFNTPQLAKASGTSQIDLLTTSNALGNSSFDQLASSRASGNSTISILSNSKANGSSVSNIATTSEASGSSTKASIANGTAEVKKTSVFDGSSRFTSVQFENGDFSNPTSTRNGNVVSIPGWDIYLEQISLAPGSNSSITSTVEGWPTPNDSFVDIRSSGDDRATSSGFSYQIIDGEIGLTVPGQSFLSYAEIHGPYIVSKSSINLEAGDKVSFDYFAQAGGDWFDVYGYLLDVDTGATVTLLNKHGPSNQQFSTAKALRNTSVETTVDNPGNYKFVFISGSFDATGGRYMGGTLWISNIDVEQANPPPINITTGETNLSVIECQNFSASKSLFTSLNSVIADDTGRTTESVSIVQNFGDYDKFQIAVGGGLESTAPLEYSQQSEYKIALEYVGSDGRKHTETVTISVAPILTATANISAIESNKLSIKNDTLSSVNQFANLDQNRGIFSLEGRDRDLFIIDSAGAIKAARPLKYDENAEYKFTVNYRATNGNQFKENVTLTLSDTLSATATMQAEQANIVTINSEKLSATKSFANHYLNKGISGSYSIKPLSGDGDKFNINTSNGTITSKNPLLLANQETFQFEVLYTLSNGLTHSETVNLTLTESLQGSTILTAQESNQVLIDKQLLSSLNNFANRDNFGGFYRILGGNDQSKFLNIMSSGDIRSSVPLEYDNQTSFNFEVRYTSVEGKEFVENVNLNITDTLNSTAYLLAEQSQNVVINPSDLSSSKEFAEKYTARGDPGVFSFANTGSDWQKFNINTTTGKITSKQALTIEEQASYQFNVLYTTNSGTVHNELVNLTLSESLQATSSLTSKEANRVQVNVDELKSLSAFANRDFDRGSYEISGGTHSNAFHFTGRKTIESTQIIEFDERSSYTFDVTYTGSDGRKFTETVNLAIQDTLSSTSTLAIEQSKSAQILAETLASTQSFANKYELTGPTGQYQILSRSSNLKNATVDNSGNITSNGELLLAEGQTGFLELQYTAWNGQKHVERVNLTVTDSLQGKSEVFAKEANIVGIDAYDLTGIGHFALQDGSKGQFFLENYQDNNSFNIDNSGFISSKSNIEFDTKSQYEFKVAYRASDGRIYRETVDLFIEDTFKGLSSFSVEESESVEINNTTLTAIYNFATNYNTPSVKGKFELKESNDSKFFSVNEDNGTINSIGELRKSTQDRYNITLIYTAPDGITSFEEDIDLRVLDSTFNRAISNLTVKESSEVTIKNETNEFINTFAKSDNFQGRFELSSSDPFRQEYKNYEVDEQGNIKSTIDIDFESVALNQDLLLTYYHSDGVQSYRNQIDLKITNDVRDDDSLNLEDVDVGTQEKAKVAFGVLDAAIAKLSEVESNLGAVENRLSHAIDYQTTSSMITESSRGRIMDADFATETASLSKSLILQEAATAMLAQSNRLQSQVLMLLR